MVIWNKEACSTVSFQVKPGLEKHGDDHAMMTVWSPFFVALSPCFPWLTGWSSYFFPKKTFYASYACHWKKLRFQTFKSAKFNHDFSRNVSSFFPWLSDSKSLFNNSFNVTYILQLLDIFGKEAPFSNRFW